MPGETEQGEARSAPATTPPSPKPASGSIDTDTGAALRSVYQKTVDEAVPDAMMDLLGRLD